jgi:hypothetical protein
MPIKRRGFVRGLLLAPAAQAALSAQTPPAAPTPAPARRAVTNVALLTVTEADVTAETRQHYFSQEQFQTLQKLAAMMMPPMKGNPGALDAKAPEFLDFLISVSPRDRQDLYLDGLDDLNAEAQRKFAKAFAQLDAQQADGILKPLMVARPWAQDRPSEPIKDFVSQVHDDLRTATMNSREWAEASAKSGRRFTRGSQSRGFLWKPIDPLVGE